MVDNMILSTIYRYYPYYIDPLAALLPVTKLGHFQVKLLRFGKKTDISSFLPNLRSLTLK